jgi:hypothetical protein
MAQNRRELAETVKLLHHFAEAPVCGISQEHFFFFFVRHNSQIKVMKTRLKTSLWSGD